MDADDRENLQIVVSQLHQLRASAVQSGFLQRLKMRGDIKVVNLYREYVNSIASLWYSYGAVDDAMLYRGRARKRLQAAEEYYAIDEMKRRIDMIKAREKLLDLELQAEIAEIQREQKRAAMLGGGEEVKKDTVNEEFAEDLKREKTARMVREEAERQIDEFIRRKGGKGNMSDADKAHTQHIRDTTEAMVNASGL